MVGLMIHLGNLKPRQFLQRYDLVSTIESTRVREKHKPLRSYALNHINIDDLIYMYKDGASIRSIAKLLKIHRGTVSKFLLKAGITIRPGYGGKR